MTTLGTFDGVHRRNLSKVLSLVHYDGPLSRAQVTAATGLNRSTVATLVSELAALDLVVESAPDPTNRVGRPSPVVAPHPLAAVVAVNPEVDAITIAAVGLGGRVLHSERIEVDHVVGPEEVVEIVEGAVSGWTTGELAELRFLACGVAVPGQVRRADGLVRWAPHLGWSDAAVRDLLESAIGLPTVVDNDASLGAVAEHLFGAGRGVDDVVYLNGGASGIGGGLIVHGRLVGGSAGYAGEFGQNRPGIAEADDRRAPGGVLEDEVSRARLLEAVGLATADEPTLADALMLSTDAAVHGELERQRRILATALCNAINVLNPSLVILGGFLATVAQSDLAALEAAVLAQALPVAGEGLEIRVAGLGEDRLLIGAAEAAFAAVLADPESAAPEPVLAAQPR
ncbi:MULTISPECIES: ROK family protein [unclassified Leifsonia]|uniref:ROK family protein n=1 Tax=unclassified Leifsonia TaxID=2663824 RepID=UPI0006F35E6D|nr:MULTISPECIES: ROK family protein [unclassified Leifsonia]KQX05622.1 transcriptional regulator [Leifsonia sp. Root1293]KRA09256.1 transcriptional regulator [Leifsonia sp. Root60]